MRRWRGRGTRCHRGLVKALPRVSTGPWSAPLRGRPAPCHRCPRSGVPSDAYRSLAKQVGEAATETSASAHRRRCGRPALAGDPAGPDSTDPSPCGDGGGVAPAQLLPAAAPTGRHRHGLLLLGPSRPSSSPWRATAGPAPPPTARCRAPDTAGRRGCRTAAHRHDTPGSANRRSAECTDERRRAWASSCNCAPCRSPSQGRGRSPRADESSGRSPGVTALGLFARLRPTHQPGGHGQGGAASRPTVLPAVIASGSHQRDPA
jgi:hypothetical protein